MSENISCMLLLLGAVAGILSVSDAKLEEKYVCPGDVQAFKNIEFNINGANISLSINGDRNAQIAVWSIQNGVIDESIAPEYQGRLMFDQNGTITIQNFNHFDQARYVVISKMVPLYKIYEVKLSLMVAPTTACKPVIEQLGNSLIASLNAKECGKPVAIPYWKDYDSVSNSNEPILKLIPGMENKEYYACIKGVALTCVKNITSHGYCTTFKPEGGRSPPASLEICNMNALIAVCIIMGILLLVAILAIAVIFIRYRIKKKHVTHKQSTKLLKTHKLWRKHFGKLNWDDIQALLNDDQRTGFKTYCDNLILQNYNRRRENERQKDVENDKEEASTEQQICNDPDKIKELLELRDAILCKICLLRKMNVFFLPCTHMATCTECSRSLPQCPVCRSDIKQKLTICFD